MTIEHPLEISALVIAVASRTISLIIGELLTRGQHAGQRSAVSIDDTSLFQRRAPLFASSSDRTSVKLLSPIGKETQRSPHALFRCSGSSIGVRQRCKAPSAQACCSNAGHVAMVLIQRRVVVARGLQPIQCGNQPAPKVLELPAFQVSRIFRPLRKGNIAR